MEKIISIAEGKQKFNKFLKDLGRESILVFNEKEKKIVGVIISIEDYKEYKRLKSYFKAMKISKELSDLNISAGELARFSRKELEEKNA